MTTSGAVSRAHEGEPEQALTPEQEAEARAAGVWVHQFARTLKTCRLYDGNNPTVIRFRAELAQALGRLLGEIGPVRLRFTSEDVTYEGVSLYPAKSRDDNLALPFYRDGIRGLTLHPGADNGDIDVLVDAVLEATGQSEGENDLVTMLWEAHLEKIDIDYVPAEGDHGGGELGDSGGELVPWPTPGEETTEAPGSESPTVESVETAPREDRSDDWTAGDLTVEIEAGFEELQAMSASESRRFQGEFVAEHEVPILTSCIAIAQAFLAAGATPADRSELATFLPRLLRQAVSQGSWLEARATLKMFAECPSGDWSPERFAQELLQPISVTQIVERVDAHEASLPEFVAFIRELGEPAVDLLNLVLAESQSRKNRRLLAEAIADVCKDNPERLAPWISDPRWYVVRNAVHILGWIGGPSIVGMLQAAARHADPRVRQEVVAALGQVDPRLARPLLIRMLDGADTRLMLAVLHQLSATRDLGVARLLIQSIQAESFEARPTEEKRAIYSALAGTADDAVLPDLDFELHKGTWFAKNQEMHRQAIARCIARIGTPAARAILERGLTSRRPPVRKACEDAMGGLAA